MYRALLLVVFLFLLGCPTIPTEPENGPPEPEPIPGPAPEPEPEPGPVPEPDGGIMGYPGTLDENGNLVCSVHAAHLKPVPEGYKDPLCYPEPDFGRWCRGLVMKLVFLAVVFLWWLLGAVVGFTAGYFWPHDSQTTEFDNTRYRVTPHILEYYRVLGVSDKPPPEDWNKGSAGTNDCLNLASWYVGAQKMISQRNLRIQIAEGFDKQLKYEVHMGYLKADDRARLLIFIHMAPVGEPIEKDKDLAEGVYAECIKNLLVPATWGKKRD